MLSPPHLVSRSCGCRALGLKACLPGPFPPPLPGTPGHLPFTREVPTEMPLPRGPSPVALPRGHLQCYTLPSHHALRKGRCGRPQGTLRVQLCVCASPTAHKRAPEPLILLGGTPSPPRAHCGCFMEIWSSSGWLDQGPLEAMDSLGTGFRARATGL